MQPAFELKWPLLGQLALVKKQLSWKKLDTTALEPVKMDAVTDGTF